MQGAMQYAASQRAHCAAVATEEANCILKVTSSSLSSELESEYVAKFCLFDGCFLGLVCLLVLFKRIK